MKFTLSWLKDHLDTDASLEVIEQKLSAIGLEVEGIEDAGKTLGAFTVARIVEAARHPNADRLQVCQVEVAKGKPLLEVVCGAPNARVGLVTVFAPLGTYVPGLKVTLEKKPVRGVVSNGMLCSSAELELAGEASGIMELDPAWAGKVGERYADVAGLSDPVLEVKLTPNRPDCTGVRGIARDLAACGIGKLKPEPKLGAVEGKTECPVAIKLEFSKETASACPAFAGRAVSGVKNGPSPAWLQARLKAVGLRPINALVDVTNYISLDRGRPLHVYDVSKLKGAIRARLGDAGEKFVALDGKEYAVDETMCVIADDDGVLGLGGIMGGEASGSTDATTTVFIESAYFDSVRTAATGRKVQIMSDARYRFERGIDPASVMPGLDQATDMIVKLCGGTPSKHKLAGKPPVEPRAISFDFSRVEKLTGVKLKDIEIKTILEALGCTLDGKGAAKGAVTVIAPTWRPDIHGSADLIEEVVRIAGLDRIPPTPLPGREGIAKPVLTERQKRARKARRELAARGFIEAVTYSFIARKDAVLFGGGSDALELANPMSGELSSMRPSLLPGLLGAAARNRNRGLADVALFELGQAYRGDALEDQYQSACGVRTGTMQLKGSGRHWDGKADAVGVFDVKADVFAVLAALGFDPAKAQIVREAPAWYHPGRSGVVKLGPKVTLATFGEIHPEVAKAMDLSGPVSAFEVFFEALPADKRKSRTKPALVLSDLLPVKRDFAFVLDAKVAAGDVIKAATAADKALISNVTVFDVFEGGSLAAEGKKSLAIEVTLSPGGATLTDKDIEAVSGRIVEGVKKATGGEIRS
ncbi:MAG: phenylalanine--tRNA ligase subunit beta [Hyphomicrobiaceae bacterium]